MNIVIDMNLSPQWVGVLQDAGHDAVHWSTIGDPGASDHVILQWAAAHNHVIFTHDLDFGALLAVTEAAAPSVIQVRAQDVLPSCLGPTVVAALRQFRDHLDRGVLITIDAARARARLLPLRSA